MSQKNKTIVERLKASVWTTTGFFCALAVVLLYTMAALDRRHQRLIDYHAERTQLFRLDALVSGECASLQDIIMSCNDASIPLLLTRSEDFQNLFVSYRDAVYTRGGFTELSLAEEYEPVVVALRSAIVKSIVSYRQNDLDGAKEVYTNRVALHLRQFKQFTRRGLDALQATTKAEEKSAAVFQSQIKTVAVSLVCLFVVILFVTSRRLSRSITAPLLSLIDATRLIKKGEYGCTVREVSSDEFGSLTTAFNEMAVNLGKTTTSIEELNAANQRLEIEITEHQQTEKALKSAVERIEAANQAKSQFLANMSHEIRTPMNAIIGFGDLLVDENQTKEQRESISAIRASGRNLLNLVNDILDFSKIEAGQLDIEMINCSLGKLLNSLEFMTRTHAEEKSIDFKIVAHNDLPAQIKSDPCRLQQCLLNLLNNAVKFTDQGHVHLKVSLHEDNGTHSIRFDIEDTGIGIPKHRQSAIFESFTQADGSTTRKYGGTGLGLTITRQLSELLGGELTVITEPGKGSVFSLIIPTGVDITGQPLLNRDDALAQGADESRQADTTRFSGKVLVAEDVEGNQKLMMLMLSKWGVEVAIAQDGNQALQKALSQSFDLILMDMQMPNMNGYEATCILKQRGYKTPIVALTANAMKGDDQTCIDAGCDDYLAKPIDRRELARILAKYLPGNQEDAAKAIDPIPALARESERLGSKQSSCPADTPNEVEISDTVNWDHLIDVMGDKETIQEIMPTYAKDMQEHLDKLFHAVESENCESIASHAHALKGVGRNLGSGQLTEIAGQMECSGKKNDVEKSTLLINDLKIEIEKVLTVVSQYG